MKWTIELVSETESETTAEQTVVAVERSNLFMVEEFDIGFTQLAYLLYPGRF
jgi:hypothetical protein